MYLGAGLWTPKCKTNKHQTNKLQKDRIGNMADDFIDVKLLSLFDLCDYECQVCAILFS